MTPGGTPEGAAAASAFAGRALPLSRASSGHAGVGGPSGHSQDQLSAQAVGLYIPSSNPVGELVLRSDESPCLTRWGLKGSVRY